MSFGRLAKRRDTSAALRCLSVKCRPRVLLPVGASGSSPELDGNRRGWPVFSGELALFLRVENDPMIRTLFQNKPATVAVTTPKLQTLISSTPLPTGDSPCTVAFSRWARQFPEQAAGRWWQRESATTRGSSGNWQRERDALRRTISEVHHSSLPGGGR